MKKWSVRTKHVFLFLRNQHLAKMLVLKTHENRMTSDPQQMHDMLERVWKPIENWRHAEMEAECMST